MLQACNSDSAAQRLLAAVEDGNLARIEAELDRPRTAPSDSPSGNHEQWELLEAVAADMRVSLRRFRLHATTDFAGRDVHVSVLRHLAARSLAT